MHCGIISLLSKFLENRRFNIKCMWVGYAHDILIDIPKNACDFYEFNKAFYGSSGLSVLLKLGPWELQEKLPKGDLETSDFSSFEKPLLVGVREVSKRGEI